jgi:hypothetical protein
MSRMIAVLQELYAKCTDCPKSFHGFPNTIYIKGVAGAT